MDVTAYCLWSPARTLRVRVGLRRFPLPAVSVSIDGKPAAIIDPWTKVHVAFATSKSPRVSFATYEVTGLKDWSRVDVVVDAGAAGRVELRGMNVFGATALPDRGLNFLIGSCYSSIDASLNGGELLKSPGALVDHVRKSSPGPKVAGLDATILLGDQVYLDLPPFQNALKSEELADKLLAKYITNWFDDPNFATLLHSAPILMIGDDHELWNNAPFHQWQICKTYSDQGRKDWTKVASDLYSAFQYGRTDGATPGRATTQFMLPGLSMLAWDRRFERTRKQLASAQAFQELSQFVAQVAAGSDRHGALAVMFMGSSLFSGNQNFVKERFVDKEPADYGEDYKRLWNILTGAGVPVLVVGGDIHFSRAMAAVHPTRPPVYELISSPLSLIAQGKSTAEIKHIDFSEFGVTILPTRNEDKTPYVATSRSQAVVLSITNASGKRTVTANVFSGQSNLPTRQFQFLPEFKIQTPPR